MADPKKTNLTPEEQMSRWTRRNFLVGGVAAAAGIAGFSWLRSTALDNEVPAPLRRVLEGNEKFSRAAFFSHSHLAQEFPVSMARMPKSNGDVGLDDEVEDADWRLRLIGGGGASELTIADLKALPKTESVNEIKCVEGWSEIVRWGGVRFSDFARKFAPAGPSSPYVAMMTPNGEYYVALDIESAMHPQTLLCYEMNGQPLEEDHGAPLRLAIPVKYGIKNIKRIGSIRFTQDRPADYWGERGYDWYAGL